MSLSCASEFPNMEHGHTKCFAPARTNILQILAKMKWIVCDNFNENFVVLETFSHRPPALVPCTSTFKIRSPATPLCSVSLKQAFCEVRPLQSPGSVSHWVSPWDHKVLSVILRTEISGERCLLIWPQVSEQSTRSNASASLHCSMNATCKGSGVGTQPMPDFEWTCSTGAVSLWRHPASTFRQRTAPNHQNTLFCNYFHFSRFQCKWKFWLCVKFSGNKWNLKDSADHGKKNSMAS